MEFRELETFVVVSEELHFARAAERLFLSPGRVSQIVRSLEQSIGARLFDRTSRQVRLTPLGERFLTDLRPAYDGLNEAVGRARSAAKCVYGLLRVGFLGTPSEVVTRTVAAFEKGYPECAVEMVEIPLSDPFTKVRAGLVDVAFTLLPVDEPDLQTGDPLNREGMKLALSPRHPLARRAAIEAEELAGIPLVGLEGPAPRRWKTLIAPEATPDGTPIPVGCRVATTQEGLTQVALSRGGMLFCTPTAAYHGRDDVVFVPVTGLPASELGLVWSRSGMTATVRAFNETAVQNAENWS
ncbi:LysR family transcriptional regulator [Nonomuraea typhae]|uniref:LysR substrate-binding domain-containing protein n=1 Tax=Nonomuraea typhae TaxID=2603600 RepID=UPI0012FB1954|nr:LysR family transcriptional regulator [Nonomuraea typhae]